MGRTQFESPWLAPPVKQLVLLLPGEPLSCFDSPALVMKGPEMLLEKRELPSPRVSEGCRLGSFSALGSVLVPSSLTLVSPTCLCLSFEASLCFAFPGSLWCSLPLRWEALPTSE